MKKFFCFLFATIIIILAVAYMGYKYILPKDYPVFIESFEHGVMTVQSDDAIGTDNKFEIFCKPGQKVTININPERSEKAYYNLSKLTLNGVDVTDDVNMLEYTFKVEGKTTVLAYFEKSESSSTSSSKQASSTLKAPQILDYAANKYIGSANAYNICDPSIIYDEESGYYYCFASNNIVMRSEDLQNWDKRTNYFQIPEGSDSKEIMSFSQFDSVKSWAKSHGYSSDETLSTISNNRKPTAPDIIKINNEYFLYFALNKEINASESAIFCVKTNNLAESIENADWEDVGLVINSCGHNSTAGESFNYDPANATHPSVFEGKGNDKLYMSYGSYYGREEITGSICLVELDKSTGLLKNNSTINDQGDEIATIHGDKTFHSGVKIASPGRIPSLNKNDGNLISASDIIYNSSTGYYYLFVTYGISDTNFEIRVARSKDPDGPYLDFNENDVASFNKKDMYSLGTKLISGYNFTMSLNGGVSYTDVGRASIGAPCVIKLENGKWIMASQSRLYYKFDGSIYCGENVAKENELDIYPLPCLELRQLDFRYDWPLALPETYDNESVGSQINKADLYGDWDVLVFEGNAPSPEYDSIIRNTSQKVSLFYSCAITETMVDKNQKLNRGAFVKVNSKEYSLELDGVTYRIFPAVVWDSELNMEVTVLYGIGDNGNVLWAKKAYNAYMGIYLDVFEYLVEIADDETADKFKTKLKKISEDPSQDKIDSFCLSMVKSILDSYDK